MTDELSKTINDHYQKGQGSIQDLARVYKISVEEVLVALGMSDMTSLPGMGDLIDQSEAGPSYTPKAEGDPIRPNFSVN